MADPNDTTTPAQGNPAAQGNTNGNGKARIVELEKLLGERDAALLERDRKLAEANGLLARREEEFRTFELEAKGAFDKLRAENDELRADNERLRRDASRRPMAAPERVVGRDDPRRWRAQSRLCCTIDGQGVSIAAEKEFTARLSDLEDDQLVLGVDFVPVDEAPATPARAPATAR